MSSSRRVSVSSLSGIYVFITAQSFISHECEQTASSSTSGPSLRCLRSNSGDVRISKALPKRVKQCSNIYY